MTTVLICDDSVAVHESLSIYLREENICVLSAYDAETALHYLRTKRVHLLILDLMLPGKPGLEVLREVRKTSDIPVIILSAKDGEVDRILGLELGADDYVTKPFSPKEMAARVRAVLRRSDKKQERRTYTYANLFIDQDGYTARVGDVRLELSAKELQVLTLFAANPETALSRERIMNAVWGYEYYNDVRAVDTQIMRIRQKLPETAEFRISSIYGVGYRLEKK